MDYDHPQVMGDPQPKPWLFRETKSWYPLVN